MDVQSACNAIKPPALPILNNKRLIHLPVISCRLLRGLAFHLGVLFLSIYALRARHRSVDRFGDNVAGPFNYEIGGGGLTWPVDISVAGGSPKRVIFASLAVSHASGRRVWLVIQWQWSVDLCEYVVGHLLLDFQFVVVGL